MSSQTLEALSIANRPMQTLTASPAPRVSARRPLALAGALLFLSTPVFASAAAPAGNLTPAVAAAAGYVSGGDAQALRRLEAVVRQSVTDRALRRPAEAALLQLLETPGATHEARLFACQQLAIIGSADSLPALGALLRQDETVGMACLALGANPSPKADELLLREALGRADAVGRAQILQTLGERRSPKVVDGLITLARLDAPTTAQAAVVALGKIGTARAVAELRRLAQTAPAYVETGVREALLTAAGHLAARGDRKAAAQLCEPFLAEAQPVFIRRAALAALLRLDADGGQRRALAVLRGGDTALKPVALAAVRDLPAREASATFARELPALAPEEQAWLLAGLAGRGDAAARAALHESLASPHAVVRRAAADALGEAGHARSVPALVATLAAGREADETRGLVNALSRLPGGAETDRALIAALRQADPPVQVHLLSALAGRRSPAVTRALLDTAGSGDAAVVRAAFRALSRSVDAAELPALLDRFLALEDAGLRRSVEAAVQQAVANVEPAAARSAAVGGALERAPDAGRRAALLGLLPACGDERSLAAARQALAAAEAEVHSAAVAALAEWPDAGAWDALLAVYERPAQPADRDTALRGLVRLAGDLNRHPDAELVPRYRSLLAAAKTDAELKLILSALAGAAHPETLQLALPLLDRPGVRAEATAAVKSLAEALKAAHPQAAAEALRRLQQSQ